MALTITCLTKVNMVSRTVQPADLHHSGGADQEDGGCGSPAGGNHTLALAGRRLAEKGQNGERAHSRGEKRNLQGLKRLFLTPCLVSTARSGERGAHSASGGG